MVSLLFILLFVYAAVTKLMDFQTFKSQLGQSPLLAAFATMVPWGIIIIEILVALLLSFKKTRLLGLYVAFFLMALFTAYIVIILNFTPFVPCSCGGVLEALGWTEHLVFNCVFIAFALLAIALIDKASLRKIYLRIFLVLLTGIGIMVVLFTTSVREIKRNNAFQRTYIPHALEKIGEYKLESNAFYIAGVDNNTIYLGNYNAPLYLKTLSIDLEQLQDFKIDIDNYDLPYKRVRIEVRPPYFYIGDGTVPVLFMGQVGDWKAKTFSQNDAYFYHYVSQNSSTLVLTTTHSETGATTLGLLKNIERRVGLSLYPNLLLKQGNTPFETDGLMLWNDDVKQIIYVYHYINRYDIADALLRPKGSGKTIDTISRGQIDVSHYTDKNAYKRGAATVVNRYATTYGTSLYIHSDRLGKYEDETVLQSASIIDHYDFIDKSYVHSFYLYHQPQKKLREFKVVGDMVIGLVDDVLWVYRIKKKYSKI